MSPSVVRSVYTRPVSCRLRAQAARAATTTITASLPTLTSGPAQLQISLRMPGEAARAEVNLLDSIAITYMREFVAVGDRLELLSCWATRR